MKVCSKCSLQRPKEMFWNQKSAVDGLQSRCKACAKVGYQTWREENLEYAKAQSANWHANNSTRAKELARNYKKKNKKHLSGYQKNKRTTDPNYREAVRLRNLLRSATKRELKGSQIWNYVGCSINEFKKHIESTFEAGMTWDNWSNNGWHIDHIQPLASFDLTNEVQKLKAFHYLNTRALWCTNNWQKGSRRG